MNAVDSSSESGCRIYIVGAKKQEPLPALGLRGRGPQHSCSSSIIMHVTSTCTASSFSRTVHSCSVENAEASWGETDTAQMAASPTLSDGPVDFKGENQ